MSIIGKRDNFEREDLVGLANMAGIKKAHANEMIDHVLESVRRWPAHADKAGIFEKHRMDIQASQRTQL
jgi:serine/threonine-protein kinase HipA